MKKIGINGFIGLQVLWRVADQKDFIQKYCTKIPKV